MERERAARLNTLKDVIKGEEKGRHPKDKGLAKANYERRVAEEKARAMREVEVEHNAYAGQETCGLEERIAERVRLEQQQGEEELRRAQAKMERDTDMVKAQHSEEVIELRKRHIVQAYELVCNLGVPLRLTGLRSLTSIELPRTFLLLRHRTSLKREGCPSRTRPRPRTWPNDTTARSSSSPSSRSTCVRFGRKMRPAGWLNFAAFPAGGGTEAFIADGPGGGAR